jgi:hypothetical protein
VTLENGEEVVQLAKIAKCLFGTRPHGLLSSIAVCLSFLSARTGKLLLLSIYTDADEDGDTGDEGEVEVDADKDDVDVAAGERVIEEFSRIASSSVIMERLLMISAVVGRRAGARAIHRCKISLNSGGQSGGITLLSIPMLR